MHENNCKKKEILLLTSDNESRSDLVHNVIDSKQSKKTDDDRVKKKDECINIQLKINSRDMRKNVERRNDLPIVVMTVSEK